MAGYRCRFFGLQELVHPSIYDARGERAWELLNPYALMMLDKQRATFGPTTVNTWAWGDMTYTLSGLRPWNTKIGAKWSMHKYGGAFDTKYTNVTVQEAYAYILKHQDEFEHITVLENIDKTPTWLHFDVRNHMKNGIWIVQP